MVQRYVLPLLVILGRALGKDGMYADAPEPLGRWAGFGEATQW